MVDGGGTTMRHYRDAIFKYAILINVPVAIYVIQDIYPTISLYFREVSEGVPHSGVHWDEWMPLSRFVFAVTLTVMCMIFLLATVYSVWRNTAWIYWTRIFTYLAIHFVAWAQFVMVMAVCINEASDFRNWTIMRYGLDDSLIAILASLWLAYNISYRPQPKRVDSSASVS
jgi:hypothetical protein